MKKALAVLIAGTLRLSFDSVFGTDIQSGESFVDGQSFTAARANNAINGATITAAFIANKSTGTPASADSFLYYSAGGNSLLRVTLTSLQAAIFASPTLSGTASVSQVFTFTGTVSPAQITGDQNDYAPAGILTGNTLRLSSDAARTVTGLAALNTNGQIYIIHNIGSFNITLSDENAGSAAGNRFALAQDYVLRPDEVALLQYDTLSLRWRAVGRQQNLLPTFSAAVDASNLVTVTCDSGKVSQNSTITLVGNRQLVLSGLAAGMSGELRVTQDGTGARKLALPGPNFTDGVGNGTTTFTSATATFTAADAGGPIAQPGATNIPVGTLIASYTNATTVTLSASCTAASGITFYLPKRQSKVVGAGNGSVTLSSAATSLDILTWSYDGTYLIWAKGLNCN